MRRVRDLPQRLAEAGRLGFRAAIVPNEAGSNAGGSVRELHGMQVVAVPDVDSALRVLDLGKADSTPLFNAV